MNEEEKNTEVNEEENTEVEANNETQEEMISKPITRKKNKLSSRKR